MNLFQTVTLSLLGVLLVYDCLTLLRRRSSRKVRLARCTVWAGAMVAIADPMLPQTVAGWLGIGRGTDLVLYLFVLAFLLVSFGFYARYLRLQRQLTEVVRHLAIQEARFGEGQPGRIAGE